MSRKIRVLLVEDEAVQRELTALVLERAGDMEVTVAADGLEGLERAWSDRPDVIVLELVLPGISGLELLRRYRREGGGARVLVLTQVSGTWVKGAALGAGADFLLNKPALWSELVEDIRCLAGGLARSCEALLTAMGAPPRRVGVWQAARCAGLIGESGRQPLLKEVYLQTAREEGTSVACVEKNVRKLIEEVWKADSAVFRKVMGRTGPGERPTNLSFLTALSRAGGVGGVEE